MIWKLAKIIALLPFLFFSLALFILPLLWLPWYCILGALLMVCVVLYFVYRSRFRGTAGPAGSGFDRWSKKSEVINW